jgi:ribosomal protein S13
MKEARIKLDGYTAKFKNEELMKTLSPEEQRALSQNAKNFYETHEKLRREIDYLDMTRHTDYMAKALNALEKGHTQLEYVYTEIVGKCGDIILPHLLTIKTKHWDGGLYKQKVTNLSIEMEAQVHDLYEEELNVVPISSLMAGYTQMINIHLQFAESYMWLMREVERLNTESMPEIASIPLPEEILPQVPAAPVKGN